MTDEELMEMYQAGDAKAFGELYTRYESKIYGYLKKRGLTSEQADDVFQQIFLKLHRFRQNYQSKHTFAAWVFTLTRNMMLDTFRADKKIKSQVTLEQMPNMVASAPDTVPEIDLNVLDTRGKNLIQARFLDEKSYEEISQQMGMSQANVRQLISRALKKLKTVFGGGQNGFK